MQPFDGVREVVVADKVYNTAAWKQVRKVVLARDGGMCMLQGPGCKLIADCVDHIIAVRDGGAWYDLSNLRASCHVCNSRRAKRVVKHKPSREW